MRDDLNDKINTVYAKWKKLEDSRKINASKPIS